MKAAGLDRLINRTRLPDEDNWAWHAAVDATERRTLREQWNDPELVHNMSDTQVAEAVCKFPRRRPHRLELWFGRPLQESEREWAKALRKEKAMKAAAKKKLSGLAGWVTGDLEELIGAYADKWHDPELMTFRELSNSLHHHICTRLHTAAHYLPSRFAYIEAVRVARKEIRKLAADYTNYHGPLFRMVGSSVQMMYVRGRWTLHEAGEMRKVEYRTKLKFGEQVVPRLPVWRSQQTISAPSQTIATQMRSAEPLHRFNRWLLLFPKVLTF